MSDITIERLHEAFIYEASTGNFYSRSLYKDDTGRGKQVGYISDDYVNLSIGRKRLRAHRVAWAMHYGEWPSEQIDHIDRNKLNNRIDNLRLATNSQNNANVGPQGAVPAKGVCWDKKREKFRAQIKINGVGRTLGYFETVDEAAHAYNKQAIKLHGEFAVLNPIGVHPSEYRPTPAPLTVPQDDPANWVIQGVHGAAKLTKEQVLIIRETYAARKKYQWGASRMAKEFGVSKRTVQLAATSGTWNGLVRIQQTSAQVDAEGGGK